MHTKDDRATNTKCEAVDVDLASPGSVPFVDVGFTWNFGPSTVKNPVREHGASSMEKAVFFWGLIANGRRWSANGRRWSANGRRWSANGRRWSANGRRWSANGRPWSAPIAIWPFIPDQESGPFWLFHVRQPGRSAFSSNLLSQSPAPPQIPLERQHA